MFSEPIILGAPVATGVLHPAIGGTMVDGVPPVYQRVTGNVVNTRITSQVSRKLGHGT